MLHPLYKEIEALVTPIIGVKGVEWYNAQYDANIPKTPVLFVEFPEAYAPTQVSKDLLQGPLRIRIHVASKVLTAHNNKVPGNAIDQNEEIGHEVMGLLKGNNLGGKIKPLRLISWQHWHRWQGWMVTLIEFEGSLTLQEA